MLYDDNTLDFCIKFLLPKRFFISKKIIIIRDILVFFVFLMVKINGMVLIESNSKFRGQSEKF
jgi:hypothetical protein